MSYLFYVDEKQNLIIHPEVVKLCPSFQALDEKEVLYVVLAYDYCSIYRQQPEHIRKQKAMWHAFNENEHEIVESSRVLAAVKDYISLQYNPKIETARVYQQKIDKMLELLREDNSPTSIKKTTDAITSLRQNIQALEKEVDEQIVNDGVVKGKMTLSYLEKLQANMKRYRDITALKK